MHLGLLWYLSCLVLSATPNEGDFTSLAPGAYVLHGTVNAGLFVKDGAGLLVDCGEDLTPERLKALGVDRVERILMTQHRRPNAMGAYRFVEDHGAEVVVSEKDRPLFADTEDYWNNWNNRWHIYHMQPGPQVLPRPLVPTRTVKDGDVVEWRGLKTYVLETPGATEGAVSYVVEMDGKRLAFIGDTMYGPGQVLEIYSLQKGFKRVGDYHGFLGMREPLLASLDKLTHAAPTLAIPSHGQPFAGFGDAAALLAKRLDELYRNYVSISAINHYFPSQFAELANEPARMQRAEQPLPPIWVRRVAYTSFAIMSDSGDALLIDCGQDSVLAKLDEWKKEGSLKAVEGCWVTHYHDDHVDSLFRLANQYIPIMCDARMAEVLERPQRYYLPCISPTPVPVARKTADGETWKWREFNLTAFHFPGQTLYHGGLLVEGHGVKVFFAGDSGAPSGLDDYCAANRTFLGPDQGSRRCLDIWRTIKPDFIFNQHQNKPFRFTDEQLDYMERVLIAREEMIAAVTPWENANFALDENWIRSYPYEQEAAPGDTITVGVQATNHGEATTLAVRPLLPKGWRWLPEESVTTCEFLPHTNGWVGLGAEHPDAVISVRIVVPADSKPGLYTVPLSLDYGDWNLSAYRHALVRVR